MQKKKINVNFKNKNMMNIDVVKIQQKIKTLNIWVHSSHHHHQSSYRFPGLIRDKGFIATWARDFFQNIFCHVLWLFGKHIEEKNPCSN